MPVKVSVVVPNYNYAHHLDERMRSLLAQTFQDLEILVVDDGSTDDSRRVLAPYLTHTGVRSRFYPENAGSTYQRWNDGAALTTGEYLLFAGADDSCEPTMVETLARTLDAKPAASLAYVRSRIIDAEGRPQSVTPSDLRWSNDFVSTAREEVPFLLVQKTIPTASAVMIRRSLFDRCGGFDTSLQLAADHMLWARLLQHGEIAYVAQPLNHFRYHAGTVRATTKAETVVLERYRVFAFIVEAFAVTGRPREDLCERLARQWSDVRPGRNLTRQRDAVDQRIYDLALRIDPAIDARLARHRAGRRRVFGVRIHGPRAVAQHVWKRSRNLLRLIEGKIILRRYSMHYRRAQRAYRAGIASPTGTAPSVQGTGVMVVRPGGPAGALALPAGYTALVERVAIAADRALSRSAGCRFVPGLRTSPVPERNEMIPEVRNRETISIQLLNPLALDGLRELCESLVSQLEAAVFGSFVFVDKVYVYRSPVSAQRPRASWVWHFDNHPREVIKVMIYLSDVAQDTAPFVYLRERASGRPMMGGPIAPLSGNSRLPSEVVARHLANGCEEHAVTGPRGTMLVFDNNVVHRGTLAETGHRDVVVFQVRPATLALRPALDPGRTGSFGHRDINRNPDDLTQHRDPAVVAS